MKRSVLALAALCAACGKAPAASSPEIVRLWPGQAPGTESWSGTEQAADAELPNVGKIHVITNVTHPTITIVRPAKPNGTGVVIVPGGAFRALPWDLDGTEPARWFADRGITAFILKYRVRPPDNAPLQETFDAFAARTKGARDIAVADAEQAMRFIRSHAKQYAVDPHRVGMIGFSAGAMTTMSAAAAQDASVRPDFAVSLYGALLDQQRPAAEAPPAFIAAAQDDPQVPPAKAVAIFEAWKAAGRPAELHLYERGGHGFGFRIHRQPADRWPVALQEWLRARGYIKP
jgi:dienelactone hydrolase